MDKHDEFKQEVADNIQRQSQDKGLVQRAEQWVFDSAPYHYTYNFSSLGRPIIQLPQDMVAMQEIIWDVKPDLIIETGIAHGGSLIASASMLALLEYCDAQQSGEVIDPNKPKRKVLAVDIDIREHNRSAIEQHPMNSRIDMIQGSSIAPEVIEQISSYAKDYKRILVCLDSNHTHDHVLAELRAYAPLVSPQSYCVVFDTNIEDAPDEFSNDRPWCKGDNPKTAVWQYLKELEQQPVTAVDGARLSFEIDKTVEHKIMFTAAPDGYLKRS
jgi:cephalosporin hydroxylase